MGPVDLTSPADGPVTYELEVAIRDRAACPLRVTGVSDPERAREIIESYLAAWGLPPPWLLRAGPTLLATLLTTQGRYTSSTDHYHVTVRRTVPPWRHPTRPQPQEI